MGFRIELEIDDSTWHIANEHDELIRVEFESNGSILSADFVEHDGTFIKSANYQTIKQLKKFIKNERG